MSTTTFGPLILCNLAHTNSVSTSFPSFSQENLQPGRRVPTSSISAIIALNFLPAAAGWGSDLSVDFNYSRTQAIFYIDHFCGLCAGGRYVSEKSVADLERRASRRGRTADLSGREIAWKEMTLKKENVETTLTPNDSCSRFFKFDPFTAVSLEQSPRGPTQC